jgi:hypothetical protein
LPWDGAAERGRFDEALPLVQEGVAGRQAMGSRLAGSMLLAALVDVQLRARRYDEGLARVDEGLADADTSIAASHVAELWRLRGELLLARRVARTRSLSAPATLRRRVLPSRSAIAERQERGCWRSSATSLLRSTPAGARTRGARDPGCGLRGSTRDSTRRPRAARHLLDRTAAAPPPLRESFDGFRDRAGPRR